MDKKYFIKLDDIYEISYNYYSEKWALVEKHRNYSIEIYTSKSIEQCKRFYRKNMRSKK